MPLYEYECQACGHHLEAQQRMADAALVTCPSCGKDRLQKLISATSFHLKGGGWYKDLYSSSKPGEKGDGKPDAKVDTKSAPPTAASPGAGSTEKAATAGPSTATPSTASEKPAASAPATSTTPSKTSS